MKSKLILIKLFCLVAILAVGIASIISSTPGGGPGKLVTFGGYILLKNGLPLEGVEVTFFWPDPPNVNSDGTWTVLTDEDGWYSYELMTMWGHLDFTITPYHTEYDFSPTSYSFGEAYEEHLDLDFVAIPKY